MIKYNIWIVFVSSKNNMKKFLGNIWIGILTYLDWLKIVLSSITSVYGVACCLSFTTREFSHPVMIFLQWVISFHPLFIFFISSILLLIISIIEKIKLGSYAQIRTKLKDTKKKLIFLRNNIRELFEGLLMSFANNELNFDSQNGNNERISLYLVQKDENNNIQHLYPIARYASNPEYRKTRRNNYSINKGCVGKAYHEDWHYIGNMDENTAIEHYNYTNDEFNAIRMQSKTYAAISLKDNRNNVIGILVVESMQKDWMLERTLKQKLSNQSKYYSEICMALCDYIEPSVLLNDKERNMPW